MEREHRRQVGPVQDVAVQREEGRVDALGPEADATAGAERLGLDAVFDLKRAVARAEVALDRGRQVAAGEYGAAAASCPRRRRG